MTTLTLHDDCHIPTLRKIIGEKIWQCSIKALTLHSLFERKPFNTGQSPTASSLRIPQDGNIARVLGCSGAIGIAGPPASLAQLARARDL